MMTPLSRLYDEISEFIATYDESDHTDDPEFDEYEELFEDDGYEDVPEFDEQYEPLQLPTD